MGSGVWGISLAGKPSCLDPGTGIIRYDKNIVRRKGKQEWLVFEVIVYVLRTGCRWKALPQERFGSAIHQRLLEWGRPACSTRFGQRG